MIVVLFPVSREGTMNAFSVPPSCLRRSIYGTVKLFAVIDTKTTKEVIITAGLRVSDLDSAGRDLVELGIADTVKRLSKKQKTIVAPLVMCLDKKNSGFFDGKEHSILIVLNPDTRKLRVLIDETEVASFSECVVTATVVFSDGSANTEGF